MDVVEGQITNGGSAQLLWNVFPHWRRVLDNCDTGYELVGAADQQGAIRDLRALFERFEEECRCYVDLARDNGEFNYFNQWYEIGEGLLGSERECFFYPTSGVREKRLTWLAKHEALLNSLMVLTST